MFGCSAYVFKLPNPSKFDAKAYDGIYLESLPHCTFRVLIPENENYRITESLHVTSDGNRFPGVPGLDELMDEENNVYDFEDEQFNDSSEDEDEEIL